MDLWIRTQDKTMLIKVDHVQRMNNVIRSNLVLGFYNSSERAEEVLDEIQNLLHTRTFCKVKPKEKGSNMLFCKESVGMIVPDTVVYAEPLNINSIVYEMPEE